MFLKLIRNRRSIRTFKDKPVGEDNVKLIVEAALRSPSSRGLNPWEIIVVTDREKLAELSETKPHGAGFLKGAPLGIVILADPERCDVWVEDTSIQTTYIQLAAESLNLKSCWIQIRKRMHESGVPAENRVREILNIPGHLNVESIVAIGHPDKEKKGHENNTLLMNKVSCNGYGQSYISDQPG